MQLAAAPMPKPPHSRRRWYIVAGFLTLIVATPYGFMRFAEWRRDRELAEIYAELDAEDPHWRWADFLANLPAPPPDERNAAVQIAKVISLRVKLFSAANILGFSNSPLPDETRRKLQFNLAGFGTKALDEARRLRNFPEGGIRNEWANDPLKETKPTCLEVLNVIRLLQADALLRADQGDFDGAAESCLAMLQATNVMASVPTMMSRMVSDAGRVLTADALGRTLGQGEITEARLEQLQAALINEARHNSLSQAWRGERAFGQAVFERLRAGDSTLLGNQKARTWKEHVAQAFPSLYLDGQPEHLRFMTEAVRASNLPDPQLANAFAALKDKMDQATANPGLLAGIGYSSPAPFLLGLVHENINIKAQLRCTILAVAAERYRLQQRRLPIDQAELITTGFLKEIYVDPYDGQPLRFKKTTEHLVIYCIGPTKIDDGGKLQADGTRADHLGFVLWTPSMRAVAPPIAEEKAKR